MCFISFGLFSVSIIVLAVVIFYVCRQTARRASNTNGPEAHPNPASGNQPQNLEERRQNDPSQPNPNNPNPVVVTQADQQNYDENNVGATRADQLNYEEN